MKHNFFQLRMLQQWQLPFYSAINELNCSHEQYQLNIDAKLWGEIGPIIPHTDPVFTPPNL